jgi:hypothetical protein
MNTQVRRWWTLLMSLSAVGVLLAVGVGGAVAAPTPDKPGDVTVLKGGYRNVDPKDSARDSANGYALPLAGAAFQYDTKKDFSGAPVAIPGLTDAAGALVATDVPGGTKYFRETAAPAGWRILDQLTWDGETQPYVESVKVDGDKTVSPRFVNAAVNPPLPATCGAGLKVLLLLDTSGSTEPYRADYIAAGQAFVNGLGGSPTQLKISSFASDSYPGGTTYDLATTGGQDDANKEIDRLYGVDFNGGMTNWDAAMQDAALAGVDVIVFVTDGNPTVHVNGSKSLENIAFGIASANLAKYPAMDQKGVAQRILGVGVGNNISTANLSAMSGPVADEDYFLGSEKELAAKLREIADKLCPGTITINKTVVDGAGTETFGMLIDGQAVGEPLGNGGTTGAQAVPAGVHVVSEVAAPGTNMAEYSAQVECNDATSKGATVMNVGTSIEVKVGSAQDITCTFTNTFRPAMLTLVKSVTNDNGGTAGPADFTLAATASGEADGSRDFTSASADPVGRPVFGGVEYTLSETGPAGYSAGAWSCDSTNDQTDQPTFVQDGSTVTLEIGEHVTCTIVNNDIPPVLQLRKVVVNDNGGTAVAADFALAAIGAKTTGELNNNVTGPGTADSGPTLQSDTWTLSETGLAGYTASTWTCVGGIQDGATVAVGIGGTAVCTITNDDIAPAAAVIAPPAAPVVAPPASVRGTATLRSPQGCVAGTTALTRLTARNVDHVVFIRDGRFAKRVDARGTGLQTFSLSTSVRQVGLHKVTARVFFVTGASPRVTTLTHRFAQCRISVVTG